MWQLESLFELIVFFVFCEVCSLEMCRVVVCQKYRRFQNQLFFSDWNHDDIASNVRLRSMTELPKKIKKKMEAERVKQAKKRDRDSNQKQGGGKYGRHDDDNDKGNRKFCKFKYCKKADSKFFKNHKSNDCTMKDTWEKKGLLGSKKELNTLEELAAQNFEEVFLFK